MIHTYLLFNDPEGSWGHSARRSRSSKSSQPNLFQDLWTRGPNADPLVLTEKGRSLFSKKDGFTIVVTKRKVKRRVLEITGITAVPQFGESFKAVEYESAWDWDDMPAEIKSCHTSWPPSHSRALFQLYDDGWRVQNAK